MSQTGGAVVASIPFLTRSELYGQEKPYVADFPVDHIAGANITNHVFDLHPVRVHDLRGLENTLDLETHSACLVKARTSLQAHEAFGGNTPAMMRYVDEVVALLKREFPQYVDVCFMDYKVRKRSPEFPDGHGQKVEFDQPAALPHTDFSVAGAFMRMEDVFPNAKHLYAGREFDLLNVWRVVNGPNDDWPLAVCDYTSIHVDQDTTTNDALHPTRVGENWLLHYSDKHRWLYLSAMEDEDLLVFRNTDSQGRRSRCFHAAFCNPNATGEPRQSVEVRVVAFRD